MFSSQSGTRRSSRQLLIAAAVVLVVVVVARAYAPALEGTFIWDDHVLAENDASFRHVSLGRLFTQPFWPEDSLGDSRAPYFRPLVLLSLRFDMALGGTPVEFHFTNVFLHLVACVLVTVTAIRLGARHEAAVLASLFWGLAPRLTESVAWISGRTDVLAGVFGLAALALSPETRDDDARPHRWSVTRSVLAGLCLFAALLAKEVGVAFALALIVAAASKRVHRDRHALARTAGYIGLPVVAWVALRLVATSARKGASSPEHALGAGRRASAVFEAISRYSEMLVDFARPQTSIGMLNEPNILRALVGGVVVVLLVALLVRFGRRLPVGARIASTLAVAAMLPVLHVVPIAIAGSIAADRLLYVPLLGLALTLAVVGRSLGSRGRLVAASVCLVVAVVSFRATSARAADYGDEARFWVNAAERAHAHNVTSRNALASVVQKAGEVELSCRLYERSHQALLGSPHEWLAPHKRTLESLVSCWARSGRYEDAVRLSEDLSRRYPTSGRIQMGLGFALLHVRDFEGATSAFTRSLTLDKALTRVVAPVLAQIPRARAEWSRFSDPARRADRVAWAEHLANVGRGKEAEATYLEIALDPSLTNAVRQNAIEFLVFEGSLEAAERTVGYSATAVYRHALTERVDQRRVAYTKVDRLRARIIELAR
jgi:tetratricopeptide (TPR) repeat protein